MEALFERQWHWELAKADTALDSALTEFNFNTFEKITKRAKIMFFDTVIKFLTEFLECQSIVAIASCDFELVF